MRSTRCSRSSTTWAAGSIVSGVQEPLTTLSESQSAGLALVLGLAGALWSASGYVGAFGRAMNRIYEIGEGRPIWKLRPLMLLLTVVLVVLAAAVLLALVLTGPVALAVGDALGLGSTGVLLWEIAKWPVLLAVVVLIVALLYYATPNIRQPRFRWVSVGAVLAIVIWGAGLGGVRLLRRELRLLRQDLRHSRRRHRLPAVAVADQPGPAVRRRARLRARARAGSCSPGWPPRRPSSCRRATPGSWTRTRPPRRRTSGGGGALRRSHRNKHRRRRKDS